MKRTSWLSVMMLVPMALVSVGSSAAGAAAGGTAQPGEAPSKAPGSLEGTWYEVGVECPFCLNFDAQNLSLSKDITLIRYSDRLEIASSLKSAKFVVKGQGGGEGAARSARAFPQVQRNLLYLVQYAEGEDQRTSDTFARVWVLSPLADGKILYGRRYLVSAFSDDAFEARGKGFRAKEKFLPPERLLANLEDVRVSSLNEARKVYQPSDQVRFALEGAVAYVREGIGEADIALGKEQARLQAQEHAGRETLFRTLVQQGDQAYAAGNFEDALNRYKAASTILPDVALVHSDLGAVYQVLNKLPEAEAAYRLAIELDGSDLDSAFNLAQVLEQSGRLPEALKLYKQVLERRPQDAEAKEHATRLSQKLGQ